MPKMKNKDVIREFAAYNIAPKVESHTGNLYITQSGRKLMNYGTCLAQRVGESTILVNATKYSTTTSKIQSWIRHEFAYNPSVITVEKVPMWTSDLTKFVPATTVNSL